MKSSWPACAGTTGPRGNSVAPRTGSDRNKHLADWRLAVSGTPSKTPLALVDQLAANPFLTVKGAAKRLGVAFTTAQRAVAKLEELSIITEISQAKRDRVYCAKALLDILEEPARLTSLET